MKIDSHIIRKCLIGFAVGILMNGTGIFATDPTNIDPKLNSLTPDPAQPDKVLLARGGGGGHGGGGHGGGFHGGGFHGGGSHGGFHSRGSNRMPSGPRSGAHEISHVGPGRSNGARRSGSTAGSKKSFSGTRKGSTSGSNVSSKKGTSSKSVAKRGGRGGRGGGHGGGRHHGGHGHHGHNHYWHNFGWGPGWGCWFSPWWGFWGFPGYWAWYWPGFALSVFYAGLYAPQPYVIVLGENSANYYAVYTRSQDDDGNVVYIKTDRDGTVDPNEKTKIEITDRSNNVVIIARDKKKLDDTLSSDAVSSKDDYSVVDPSEAPDKLKEGENPEVTDTQIEEFQNKVTDTKNTELLKEKARATEIAD